MILDVVNRFVVVVSVGVDGVGDVARYNVEATKVGLVGKNVVGGVTLLMLP